MTLKRPVCECGHDDDEHAMVERKRWNCLVMHCACVEYVNFEGKEALYKQYGVTIKKKGRP